MERGEGNQRQRSNRDRPARITRAILAFLLRWRSVMQQWEYCTVRFKGPYVSQVQFASGHTMYEPGQERVIADELSRLGEEGWEAVTVLPLSDENLSENWLLMKRPSKPSSK